MKTKLKMISVLLAVLLVYSLTGVAAFADPVPVPGGAVLNVSVTVDRDEYVPGSYIDGEGNEIPLDPDKVLSDGEQIPVCNVSYVSRDNQEIGYEDSLINLLDRDRQIGIRLTPLDGFYIYDIALVGGDYAPSSKSLLSAAKAKLGTTTVTLFLSDVAGPEGGSITINGDYVSSWGVGSDCTLNVSCRRINENVQTYVSYDSGEHYAETPWGEAGNGAWICYAADMPQTLVTDESGTWQFTGYKLVYDTGAYQDIDAQDEILVYTNATLVAQWEDVSDQYQGSGNEDTGSGDDYYTENTGSGTHKGLTDNAMHRQSRQPHTKGYEPPHRQRIEREHQKPAKAAQQPEEQILHKDGGSAVGQCCPQKPEHLIQKPECCPHRH